MLGSMDTGLERRELGLLFFGGRSPMTFLYGQDLQTVSIKGKRVNILDFVDHIRSLPQILLSLLFFLFLQPLNVKSILHS